MDIKKILPMSPTKGPPLPKSLKITWPWSKPSITIYDKDGKTVGLALSQLNPSQSYTIGVNVTNNSTQSGQVVAATLSVAASVVVGSTNILSTQQSHAFAAGETYQFYFTMTIPSGSGGQSGSIQATLLDPSNNQLNQANVMIQVAQIPSLTVSVTGIPSSINTQFTPFSMGGPAYYIETNATVNIISNVASQVTVETTLQLQGWRQQSLIHGINLAAGNNALNTTLDSSYGIDEAAPGFPPASGIYNYTLTVYVGLPGGTEVTKVFTGQMNVNVGVP